MTYYCRMSFFTIERFFFSKLLLHLHVCIVITITQILVSYTYFGRPYKRARNFCLHYDLESLISEYEGIYLSQQPGLFRNALARNFLFLQKHWHKVMYKTHTIFAFRTVDVSDTKSERPCNSVKKAMKCLRTKS